jgi:hypothetical protein
VDVVMTWPINDPGELERVPGRGVPGVISDEPEVLTELMNRRA